MACRKHCAIDDPAVLCAVVQAQWVYLLSRADTVSAFVPAKSSKAKPSLRFRLCPSACTAWLHGVKELRHVGLGSVFTRLLDKSVKLVLQTTLLVLSAITRQPGFLWFVVKDSCVKRLFRLRQRQSPCKICASARMVAASFREC